MLIPLYLAILLSSPQAIYLKLDNEKTSKRHSDTRLSVFQNLERVGTIGSFFQNKNNNKNDGDFEWRMERNISELQARKNILARHSKNLIFSPLHFHSHPKFSSLPHLENLKSSEDNRATFQVGVYTVTYSGCPQILSQIPSVNSPNNLSTPPRDREEKISMMLDTGSLFISLPLSSSLGPMESFVPLFSPEKEEADSAEGKAMMRSIGRDLSSQLKKCPLFIKEGFYCANIKYAGEGINLIVGQTSISSKVFMPPGKGSSKAKYVEEVLSPWFIVGYELNYLYGEINDTPIVGIGCKKNQGIKETEFLKKMGAKRNLMLEGTRNLPRTDRWDSEELEAGRFLLDVDIEALKEGDEDNKFYWVDVLTNHDLAFFEMKGLDVLYGNSIEGGDRPTVAIHNQLCIFDSGTNGLILTSSVASRFMEQLESLNKIFKEDSVIFSKVDDSTLYFFWDPAMDCKIRLQTNSVGIEIPINILKLSEVTVDGKVYYVTFLSIFEDKSRINVMGYPLWKKFDVLFDGENGRMGIRKGNDIQDNENFVLRL